MPHCPNWTEGLTCVWCFPQLNENVLWYRGPHDNLGWPQGHCKLLVLGLDLQEGEAIEDASFYMINHAVVVVIAETSANAKWLGQQYPLSYIPNLNKTALSKYEFYYSTPCQEWVTVYTLIKSKQLQTQINCISEWCHMQSYMNIYIYIYI